MRACNYDEHEAVVRQIRETHVRVCVPEPVCRGCLRAWPCPAVRRVQHALAAEVGWISGSCGSSG
jgi:hypothetical protein